MSSELKLLEKVQNKEGSENSQMNQKKFRGVT